METIEVDNIKLPNKPLSNIDLEKAVKALKIKNFRGIFLRDNLPKKEYLSRKECGILNLDSSFSGKNGTHWVSWHKNNDKKYYFDSFGVRPPKELKQYLGDPIYYNTEQIQKNGYVICGHLCLYVLKKLSDGFDFQEIINNLF